MRRVVLYDIEQLRVEDVASHRPAPDEVKVAVEACGICGSDLHMFRGRHPVLKPPLEMGHEFVGRVIEVGADVTTLSHGDRVVAMAARGCGDCPACLAGDTNQCNALVVIGGDFSGGLSEEVVLPADQFVAVPTWLDTEGAALIEVAAVAVHTIRRHGPIDGRSCLVLGAGPVGLLLVRLLKAFGAGPVIVSDVSARRRELAAVSGADQIVNLNTESDVERLATAYPYGVDSAFDCAGRQQTLQQALQLTRRGGSVLLTAIFERDCIVPMLLVQRAERKLIGVHLYRREDFETVIRLLEDGQLDLSGIVTHQFRLEDTEDAFRLLLSSETPVGKALIRMERTS
jgi:L-iditol 2-dehydrogenase